MFSGLSVAAEHYQLEDADVPLTLLDENGEEILEETAGPYRAGSQRQPSIRNLPLVHQSGGSPLTGVDGGRGADDEDVESGPAEPEDEQLQQFFERHFLSSWSGDGGPRGHGTTSGGLPPAVPIGRGYSYRRPEGRGRGRGGDGGADPVDDPPADGRRARRRRGGRTGNTETGGAGDSGAAAKAATATNAASSAAPVAKDDSKSGVPAEEAADKRIKQLQAHADLFP